jgi:hypothetical protein
MRRVFALATIGSVLVACALDTQGVSSGPEGDAGLPDRNTLDVTQPTVDSGGAADTSSNPDVADHEGGAKTDSSLGAESGSSDAAAPKDVGTDAPKDAVTDGKDSALPDSSVPDGGVSYTCGGGKTADCSTCAGNVVGCAWCKGGSVVGFCIPEGDVCLGHAPAGAEACPCKAGNPSTCVAPDQGCVNLPIVGGVCVSCGEMGSDNEDCKGGGMCDQATPICK